MVFEFLQNKQKPLLLLQTDYVNASDLPVISLIPFL